MILESAILNVRPGQTEAFEVAFREAKRIIGASPGYLSHELQHCLEHPNRYLLLVRWERLEGHTVGFRQSQKVNIWTSRA